MSEMIERVARALLAADYPDDVGGETEDFWWDRHGDTYMRYARAAIDVMREPTDRMIGAGRVVSLEGERKTVEVYTAMIDAA